MMRKFFGTLCVVLGTVLVLAALGVTCLNLWQEECAGVHADQAMEQLFDRKCISQYVKKIGKNEVKLLKVDYKNCNKYGYFDL